jgi:hypothetical protein
MDKLPELRRQKDAFFAQDPHSLLTPSQKKSFRRLDYFPEAPEMRFELPIERSRLFPALCRQHGRLRDLFSRALPGTRTAALWKILDRF